MASCTAVFYLYTAEVVSLLGAGAKPAVLASVTPDSCAQVAKLATAAPTALHGADS